MIRETCACGASFEIDTGGLATIAAIVERERVLMREWHARHEDCSTLALARPMMKEAAA